MQGMRGRSPAAWGYALAGGVVLVWGGGCADAPMPTWAGQRARLAVTSTATKVLVTPNPAGAVVGDTVAFTATGYDSTGAAVAVSCRWASDDTLVASIDPNRGVARARQSGYSLIKAGCSGVVGTTTIEVTSRSTGGVASVSVAPASLTLAQGGTQQLTATLTDSAGRIVSGQTVTWSSNAAAVATVDSTGLVKAAGAGSATVTATAAGKSGSASVTVTAPTVAAVGVSPASASLSVGGTVQLQATAVDAAGNVMTGQSFTWSSSASSLATVSTAGVVTAVAAGTATITATDGGQSGSSAITVSAPPPPTGLHEPTGMTTLIHDDGSVRVPPGMTATAAWSGANGWGDLHTALVSDPTNPTGSGMAIEKRWLAGDSTDGAAHPGLIEVSHWSALNPAFAPVKLLYVRLRIWLDPSWPGPDPYALGGFKFFYLLTSQTGNAVIWTSREAGASVQWASLLNGNVFARVGNVTPGQWHTVEYLFQMSSAPGASDGSASIWLDGKQLSAISSIMWVGATSTQWACNFDGMQIYPLRGVVGHTFPQADQLRFGEIYVSGR